MRHKQVTMFRHGFVTHVVVYVHVPYHHDLQLRAVIVDMVLFAKDEA